MVLDDLLRRECVSAGRVFADKRAVLIALAHLAKQCPLLDPFSEETVLQSFEEREALGSTGFNQGLALPHGRLPGLSGFVIGLMSVPDGVPFKSLDSRKSRLFVFVVSPKDHEETHLKVLKAVAETVAAKSALSALSAETDDQRLYTEFLRYAHGTPAIPAQ